MFTVTTTTDTNTATTTSNPNFSLPKGWAIFWVGSIPVPQNAPEVHEMPLDADHEAFYGRGLAGHLIKVDEDGHPVHLDKEDLNEGDFIILFDEYTEEDLRWANYASLRLKVTLADTLAAITFSGIDGADAHHPNPKWDAHQREVLKNGAPTELVILAKILHPCWGSMEHISTKHVYAAMQFALSINSKNRLFNKTGANKWDSNNDGAGASNYSHIRLLKIFPKKGLCVLTDAEKIACWPLRNYLIRELRPGFAPIPGSPQIRQVLCKDAAIVAVRGNHISEYPEMYTHPASYFATRDKILAHFSK